MFGRKKEKKEKNKDTFFEETPKKKNKKVKDKKIKVEENIIEEKKNWIEEDIEEGELLVDVYQSNNSIVIQWHPLLPVRHS